MKKINFNHNWNFAAGSVTLQDIWSESKAVEVVHLPHDAMIHEERRPDTKNAHQTGFYPGNSYTYLKSFFVAEDAVGQTWQLEFEGVATYAKVYVNGILAQTNVNPYHHFYVNMTPYLKYGVDNDVKVIVDNPEQTSRWYSGGGIYRNVTLYIGERVHIPVDGVKLHTNEVASTVAVVTVESTLKNSGQTLEHVLVETLVYDADGEVVAQETSPISLFSTNQEILSQRVSILNPILWSADTPYLYRLELSVKTENGVVLDTWSGHVGLRNLFLSAQTGLLVNGQATRLRGACIHHDNGVLGAATFAQAEKRRVLQLKEAGFNCLRSAHHPMSKAMLEACDEYGMYVIDELYDMWTQSKNPNDYSRHFIDEWEKDIEKLVHKDYNHPSVIIYSLGNEIQEAGTVTGASWSRKLHQKIKSLDSTRYTVNGINGIIAGMEKFGDILEEATGLSVEEIFATESMESQEAAGSDQANGMMEMMMGPLADSIATSQTLRDLLEPFTASTDIAGYNYLTALHEAEKDFHPNRVVLGAETFPADIANLWKIVENNSHVIGDMTWAGYDYIGEAGCGIFHYDGTQNFTEHFPDRLAGIGDIDLIGHRKPISYYRQAVYGMLSTPYIAVKRLNRQGQTHSITPWMWKDNLSSWTWHGFEGATADVDVYVTADEVELYLDDTLLERKLVHQGLASFEVIYASGTLTAVAYTNGVEIGQSILETAGDVTGLQIQRLLDENMVETDSLVFLTCRLVDKDARWNPQEQKEISVQVTGAGAVAGMGNADPQALPSYQEATWPTYDGQLLVVIRTALEPGSLEVHLKLGDALVETLTYTVKSKE